MATIERVTEFFSQQKWQPCVTECHELLKSDPENVDAHFMFGAACYQASCELHSVKSNKLLRIAKRELIWVIRMHPSHSRSHYYLALIFQIEKELIRVVYHLTYAAKTAPNDSPDFIKIRDVLMNRLSILTTEPILSRFPRLSSYGKYFVLATIVGTISILVFLITWNSSWLLILVFLSCPIYLILLIASLTNKIEIYSDHIEASTGLFHRKHTPINFYQTFQVYRTRSFYNLLTNDALIHIKFKRDMEGSNEGDTQEKEITLAGTGTAQEVEILSETLRILILHRQREFVNFLTQ